MFEVMHGRGHGRVVGPKNWDEAAEAESWGGGRALGGGGWRAW